MTARAAVLSGIVLGSFALMTAAGALLTDGKTQGPLSLADVMVPAAIPVLMVIAVTVVCRTRSTSRGGGNRERR